MQFKCPRCDRLYEALQRSCTIFEMGLLQILLG